VAVAGTGGAAPRRALPALPSGGMRRRAARPQTRFLLAGLAVAVAEALLGVVALPTGLGPYLLCCAAMTAAVAVGVSRLLAAPAPSRAGWRRSGRRR
jgi:hypothetical protein